MASAEKRTRCNALSTPDGQMTRVLWRLLSAIPVLAGVIIVTFVITRILPCDPAVFFASNPSMTAQDVQDIRAALGLDLSLWAQFRIYLGALAEGDLGQSISTGQPVTAELLKRLPASLELTLFAFCTAVAIAIPLGIAAALRPGTWVDHGCRIIVALGVSLPTFVTGLLLIYVFYHLLGVAPEPVGRLDPFLTPPPRLTGVLTLDAVIAGDWRVAGAALRQLILPGASMALFALAPIARMTRAAMLSVLQSDFIRTARAHGLPRRQIIWSYAFRNAVLPVITTLGLTFSYMLGANVLVEKVFAWPGIGAFALDSVIALDYAPLQGFVLVMAGIFLIVNLVTDVISGLVDPRARLG